MPTQRYGITFPFGDSQEGLFLGMNELADAEVRFNARFGGKPMQVVVPMTAALAIYARENGAGAMFEAEPELDKMPDLDDEAEESNSASKEGGESTSDKPKKRGHLKVVK